MTQVLKSYMQYICGTENVAENVPLATKTTFGIGGNARFFVKCPTKQSLIRLASALNYIEEKYIIIGNGSNILASDNGFDGVVIKPAFRDITENQLFIYADAGATLAEVAAFARVRELGGLEWAGGIPATVGGAVAMNAGAFSGQISDIVVMVDVLVDGKLVTLDVRQCKFGYRSSTFAKNRNIIILGAYFFLSRGNYDEIVAKENQYRDRRNATQPKGRSAGSIFKKPSPDFFVGKVIEELGLKGTTRGGATISPQHAGFIVNTGNATQADVMYLVRLIKRKVYETHGVRLKLEVVQI